MNLPEAERRDLYVNRGLSKEPLGPHHTARTILAPSQTAAGYGTSQSEHSLAKESSISGGRKRETKGEQVLELTRMSINGKFFDVRKSRSDIQTYTHAELAE